MKEKIVVIERLGFLRRLYRKCRDLYWIVFRYSKENCKLRENITSLRECEVLPMQERIYYVIRRDERVGLFSYVQTALGQIEYAISQGYIPIIDMKNTNNSYLAPDHIGKINAWELFFNQVTQADLDEIYTRGNYVIAEPANKSPNSSGFFREDEKWLWRMLYKEFIHLNARSRNVIEEECNRLFGGDFSKTLGVHVRGTDYRFAKGHPLQPDINEVIRKVEYYLENRGYEKIFLATEEADMVHRFKKEFGKKVICMYCEYYTNEISQMNFSNQWISDISFNRKDDEYLRGIEYLATICILSKCEGLVCGLNGGSFAALYMKETKFTDICCWNLGANDGKGRRLKKALRKQK